MSAEFSLHLDQKTSEAILDHGKLVYLPWCAADVEAAHDFVFLDVGSVGLAAGPSPATADPFALITAEIAGCLRERCLSRFGFGLLSGVRFPESSPLAEIRSWFLSFCGQIGSTVPQDAAGRHVGELTGIGRGADWFDDQPFHTDGGDLLVLYCVRPASCGGGVTRLVSALTIYSELRKDPAVDVHEFFKPWAFHRGSRPGPPYYERPIFSVDPNTGLDCYFLPGTIRDTPRLTGTVLSKKRLDLLSRFECVASRSGLAWHYALKDGELLVLANKKVLHSRTRYSDGSRCLLRSWVNL